MNKTITAAIAVAKADTTKVNELKDIAVPKFKDTFARVTKACRTINRHLGPNKGNPNRATLATAIGLKDEFPKWNEVADIIGLPEMKVAVADALKAIGEIETMRKTRTYTQMPYMPEFLTTDEKTEATAEDIKWYIYNITNAVNAAIATINAHVVDGTFDVNTFKVAKALGYADEIDIVRTELAKVCLDIGKADNDAVDALDAAQNAIADIVASKANGYRNAVGALPDYNPFPENEDEDGELNDDDATDGE